VAQCDVAEQIFDNDANVVWKVYELVGPAGLLLLASLNPPFQNAIVYRFAAVAYPTLYLPMLSLMTFVKWQQGAVVCHPLFALALLTFMVLSCFVNPFPCLGLLFMTMALLMIHLIAVESPSLLNHVPAIVPFFCSAIRPVMFCSVLLGLFVEGSCKSYWYFTVWRVCVTFPVMVLAGLPRTLIMALSSIAVIGVSQCVSEDRVNTLRLCVIISCGWCAALVVMRCTGGRCCTPVAHKEVTK